MHKYFSINEKGHSIRCKIYYSGKKPADKGIVFCTGFAGHKDNMAAQRFSEKLLSKHPDVSIVVFNWPAHGDDAKKTLNLDDCNIYLQLVINTLKTKYNLQELYCYATSFGGYLVLKYISENGNPFQKIAIRCPAVDMCDVLINSVIKTDEYDRILKGKPVQVGFDRKIIVTRDLLKALKMNDIREREYLDYADDILIMHGTADEVVPFSSGREFAENNVIEFIPVEGADHRFVNPNHMSLANKYTMHFFDMK